MDSVQQIYVTKPFFILFETVFYSLNKIVTTNLIEQPQAVIIIIISVLTNGRSFTANSGTKATILPKGRSSIANSGT